MIKWLPYVLMGLMVLPIAFPCKESYGINEVVIIEGIMEETWIGSFPSYCPIKIYRNNTLIKSGNMSRNGNIYNFTAGVLDQGFYTAKAECIEGNSKFIGECQFIVEGKENMIIGISIILPMVLGIFFIAGSLMLGNKHMAFKIFLFLLSIITFFISSHFAVVSIIKYYGFTELQDAYGTTIYIVGIMLFVIITYFGFYVFYLLVKAIAESKKRKLEGFE